MGLKEELMQNIANIASIKDGDFRKVDSIEFLFVPKSKDSRAKIEYKVLKDGSYFNGEIECKAWSNSWAIRKAENTISGVRNYYFARGIKLRVRVMEKS